MKYFIVFLMAFASLHVSAQDAGILLKEADNLEKQQKEPEALDKYKQVLLLDPVNIKSLVKAAELNVLLGKKQTDKNTKRLYFESSMSFARRAFAADSTSADANYAMALASGKMTDVESEIKKVVGYVKDVKHYADKALAINPSHARANYALGKWNYEMVNLSGIKKAAVKLIYGGLPESSMDAAIQYMEKSRSIDPYFVPDFLDLAKAYKDNHQPAKAIDVLTRLAKLPTHTSEDVILKAEGARMLESMQ